MGPDEMTIIVNTFEKFGPFLRNNAAGIGAARNPKILHNIKQSRGADRNTVFPPGSCLGIQVTGFEGVPHRPDPRGGIILPGFAHDVDGNGQGLAFGPGFGQFIDGHYKYPCMNFSILAVGAPPCDDAIFAHAIQPSRSMTEVRDQK